MCKCEKILNRPIAPQAPIRPSGRLVQQLLPLQVQDPHNPWFVDTAVAVPLCHPHLHHIRNTPDRPCWFMGTEEGHRGTRGTFFRHKTSLAEHQRLSGPGRSGAFPGPSLNRQQAHRYHKAPRTSC